MLKCLSDLKLFTQLADETVAGHLICFYLCQSPQIVRKVKARACTASLSFPIERYSKALRCRINNASESARPPLHGVMKKIEAVHATGDVRDGLLQDQIRCLHLDGGKSISLSCGCAAELQNQSMSRDKAEIHPPQMPFLPSCHALFTPVSLVLGFSELSADVSLTSKSFGYHVRPQNVHLWSLALLRTYLRGR